MSGNGEAEGTGACLQLAEEILTLLGIQNQLKAMTAVDKLLELIENE